ncbi:hypothetical protein J5X98_05615 [Leptothermofonsia sichuanensis E412]|uniref:hypothetical protein n=1 Tax=Leptothermofonsia sichuanensis TaxID=2917832 RepID=UPI001CA6CCC5|nr:hypothetical protein [Leptothermofonsia sichuanensis]QZZ21906.1 hypothetical protein J5X98_05615 [Leptothermofonsia sichuanensis E412]
MFQDASTSLFKLSQGEPSDDLSEAVPGAGAVSASGNFPVESYADRLMDDLFEEVEGLLGDGLKPPSAPALIEEPAPRSPGPSTLLGMALAARFSNSDQPAAADAHPEPAPHHRFRDDAGSDFSDSRLVKTAGSPENTRQTARSYDRLLLAVGCISLITTLTLWLLFQEAARQTATVPVPAQTGTRENLNASHQFAEYMQRSLQAIDQKNQTAGSPVAQNNAAPTGLPTVTVPGSITPGTASGAAGVVGGSIVGGSTAYTPPRTSAGLDRLYGSLSNLPQSLYSPGGASAPTVAPLPAMPPRTSAAPVTPPVPLQVPGVARTLVGVVDLGEQSAILVEVNGVAQRFRLGESIGSSGWTLVEVSKNQAIIRRNGEVRSVFIGQNF